MGIPAPSQTLGSPTAFLRNSQPDNNLFQGLFDTIPSFSPASPAVSPFCLITKSSLFTPKWSGNTSTWLHQCSHWDKSVCFSQSPSLHRTVHAVLGKVLHSGCRKEQKLFGFV